MKKLCYLLSCAVFLTALLNPSDSFSQRTPGAIVYYTFEEIVDGTTVMDVSGVSPEINLTIQGEVTELDGRNGVEIGNSDGSHQNGMVTATPPEDLTTAIQASGQLTIEAWVMPVDTMQDDARLVSYSGSSTTRNFSLIIDDGRIENRIRTDITGPNGHPMNWLFYDFIPGSPSEPIHLVWTWSAPAEAFYINGALEGEREDRGSDISSWDNTFNFLIGLEANHSDPKRQFIGEVYMVAIYDLALSADEVEANYEYGSEPSAVSVPQVGSQNSIHLFPNPVSDNVTLKLDATISGSKHVSLYNCLGKLILEESFTGSRHVLNMNDIPSGLYFITVNSEQGNIVRKIIKE